MAFDLTKLTEAELLQLHEQTSGAVREIRPIQLEDIKSGMKPEDMDRAQKKISEVLRSLNS